MIQNMNELKKLAWVEPPPPRLTMEEYGAFCDAMMAMLTPAQIRRQKEFEERIESAFTM